MSVIIVLILASLAVGLIFVGAFIWSVRSGQYDDTLTPSLRVLLDDAVVQKNLPSVGSPTAPQPAVETTTMGRSPKEKNE